MPRWDRTQTAVTQYYYKSSVTVWSWDPTTYMWIFPNRIVLRSLLWYVPFSSHGNNKFTNLIHIVPVSLYTLIVTNIKTTLTGSRCHLGDHFRPTIFFVDSIKELNHFFHISWLFSNVDKPSTIYFQRIFSVEIVTATFDVRTRTMQNDVKPRLRNSNIFQLRSKAETIRP